jgi:hypothetical protein
VSIQKKEGAMHPSHLPRKSGRALGKDNGCLGHGRTFRPGVIVVELGRKAWMSDVRSSSSLPSKLSSHHLIFVVFVITSVSTVSPTPTQNPWSSSQATDSIPRRNTRRTAPVRAENGLGSIRTVRFLGLSRRLISQQ